MQMLTLQNQSRKINKRNISALENGVIFIVERPGVLCLFLLFALARTSSIIKWLLYIVKRVKP